MTMLKKPRLGITKEDPPIIVINRVLMTIGSRRYAFDTSTTCTELNPSRAQVIPIDKHVKKAPRKSMC